MAKIFDFLPLRLDVCNKRYCLGRRKQPVSLVQTQLIQKVLI